jgi:DNA-binding NtrC family response regulator
MARPRKSSSRHMVCENPQNMVGQGGYIASSNRAVLVVEDQDVSRRALVLLLRLNGFLPEAAGSGEEALRTLREGHCPPIALVDLDLPGMSGLDFIGRLHELDSEVYAVLMTAADIDRVRTALAGRPVTYLQKPVDFGRLLMMINSHGRSGTLAI